MNSGMNRCYRVADVVQSILAHVLHHEVDDPFIAGVNIVAVEMSRDLSQAKVYFTLHDHTQLSRVFIGLQRAARFFRRRLSQESVLRYTPSIRFYYDDSLIRGKRIDNLLDGLPENAVAEE